jgi:hypothetical protein
MKYRFEGKEKRLAFGAYPDMVANSLAQDSTRLKRLGNLMAHHISPDGSIADMLLLICLTLTSAARAWDSSRPP